MDQLTRIGSGLDRLMDLSTDDRARLDDEFGSSVAGNVRVGPRRSADELEAFEASAGAALPVEYARFLQEIGDGDLGPGRTFHPLTDTRPAHLRPDLPFDLPHPVVDTSAGSFPSEIAVVERVADIWSGEGVIELADYGCSMSSVLVVSGFRSGEVWFHEPSVAALTPWCYWSMLHGRIDDLGVPRQRVARSYTFLDWYEEWLHALLEFE
jgi:hypothetical protein